MKSANPIRRCPPSPNRLYRKNTYLADALAPGAEARVFADQAQLEREATPHMLRFAEKYAETSNMHPPRPWNRWLAAWRLYRRVKAFKPDIIHVHEHPTTTNVLLMEMLKKVAPIVLITHDPVPHSGADTEYFKRRSAFYARSRKAASAFAVHGAFCRDLLADTIDLQGRPILNTVNGGELRPDGIPATHGEPRRVLMFGRMQAYKGLDVLLAAAQRLKAEGVEFHLVLAGRGESLTANKAAFEALGDITIHDRFLSSEEIISEIDRCSLVVLPYHDATQSGVAISSFINHRPVVASEVGGLADIVQGEKNGLLIPAGNPDALAAALRRVFEEPGLSQSLTEGARLTAETQLNWPVAAAQLLPFFRKVIEARAA